jgi:hypothetical protein
MFGGHGLGINIAFPSSSTELWLLNSSSERERLQSTSSQLIFTIAFSYEQGATQNRVKCPSQALIDDTK